MVRGTAASLRQSESNRDSASGHTEFSAGSGVIRADSVSRVHLGRPRDGPQIPLRSRF